MSCRPDGDVRVTPRPGRVSPTASYLTVRELLGTPHLGVELLSGSQGLERPIRSSSVRTLAFGTDGVPALQQEQLPSWRSAQRRWRVWSVWPRKTAGGSCGR